MKKLDILVFFVISVTLKQQKNIVLKAWYNCDKCGYKATKEGNLKKHVELKHEGFCYYCDQCEYKAKEACKRHVSTKHEKACNQCEYKQT